jgi:FAD/FMN-containing dehydrogenase
MIDLSPMGDVRVDPTRQRAWVGGGALLRRLDLASDEHGLGTTAGNVSHTGVGGLTLGGGMGWLARQFGLSCDNVETYTLVTADGEIVRAGASENPDLFWALRGGGGNFGVVTEFEFRLHPVTGDALVADLYFDLADPAARAALRAWRDRLSDAPRPATLTSDIMTAGEVAFLPASLRGRSVVTAGFVWVGEMSDARRYLDDFRTIGTSAGETVDVMRYVDLQSSGDDRHHHGLRRYSAGHYLTEFSDAAIDAYLTRGIPASGSTTDPAFLPGGGFQAYGGAIADVGLTDSAFSHRETVVEFFAGSTWADASEDEMRIAGARAWAKELEPFSSGTYVNVIADAGDGGVARAYHAAQLARLADVKRSWDPANVFHLNQNILPAPATRE